MKVLVVGYGNELRGDDGVGPRAARIVAGWQLPEVEALAVHQLTPELVERISQAQRVVFVDAAPGTSVDRRLLTGSTPAPTLGHVGDPLGLLDLCEALHGRRPEAWLVTVPARHFEFGEGLSRHAEEGLHAAMAEVRGLTGLERPR